ncbi:MAG: hypothetical protein IJK94_00790 [Bacteroidaceae bacterium]|nr:hypothetical protein [Bacteroidaceae bacterium]
MDIDFKELIKAAAEGLDLKDFKGDVVGVKVVENEIGNVEAGGIGVQTNHYEDNKSTHLTASDKDIKVAIEELLEAKDDKSEFLFRNKKQWWAVYRVLKEFCNYPADMKGFETKMKELCVADVNGRPAMSYESLKGASKDIPKIAVCSPSAWSVFESISDNYKQQCIVADFLMLKLGIKS